MDLNHIPVVDNHAHAVTHVQPSSPEDLRTHFSEAAGRQAKVDFVGSAVQYRWALHQIAAFLGCEPEEESVLAARSQRPLAAYTRDLAAAAGLGAVLLDEGYPPPGEGFSTAEMGEMLGVPVYPMLRLETFTAGLIVQHADFAGLVAAFDRQVAGARAAGFVSLKSIAAYRTGLAIEPVDEAAAEAAFEPVRAQAAAAGSLRLNSKPLIDFFLWRALKHAADQHLPVQFHTGYGDPDLDLRLANPLHLRPIFEEPLFRTAPIVMLHESYPYTAEAAFLAAVYPNAYLDLAFSLPAVGRGSLLRGVEAALDTAPAAKLMVSSDATRIPEHYYLGAIRARAILGDVLDSMVSAGELGTGEAEAIAVLVLRANAERVYRLPEAQPPA